MPIRIRSKNSVVKDKVPLPADLEIGELALNAHQDSPAIYLKDAAGAVRKIAGVGSVSTPDATAISKGVVQLADAAAVTAGTAGRVVDAAQLKAAVAAEDLWDRSGTEISPKTAGDAVFTSGAVKVGGTTAAPNITLAADGHAVVGGAFNAGADKQKFQVVTGTSPGQGIGLHGAFTASGTELGAIKWFGNSATSNYLTKISCIDYRTGESTNLAGDISFSTRNGSSFVGERARITAAGDLLLGGTLPASPNITLSASGKITATASSAASLTDVVAGKSGVEIKGANPPQRLAVGYHTGFDTPYLQAYNATAGTARVLAVNPFGGHLSVGGDVYIGGTQTIPAGAVTGGANITLKADGTGLLTKLGVGTATPRAAGDFTGSVTGGVAVPLVVSNYTAFVPGVGAGIGFMADAFNNVIGAQIECIRTASTNHPSDLSFKTKSTTGFSERARITSTGDFLLGGTLPASPTITLSTAGTATAQVLRSTGYKGALNKGVTVTMFAASTLPKLQMGRLTVTAHGVSLGNTYASRTYLIYNDAYNWTIKELTADSMALSWAANDTVFVVGGSGTAALTLHAVIANMEVTASAVF